MQPHYVSALAWAQNSWVRITLKNLRVDNLKLKMTSCYLG